LTLGHVDGANPWLLPRIPFYAENSRRVAKMKLLLKCSSLRALTREKGGSGRAPEAVAGAE